MVEETFADLHLYITITTNGWKRNRKGLLLL